MTLTKNEILAFPGVLTYPSKEATRFSKKLTWNMCSRDNNHERLGEWFERSGIITCNCGYAVTYLK